MVVVFHCLYQRVGFVHIVFVGTYFECAVAVAAVSVVAGTRVCVQFLFSESLYLGIACVEPAFEVVEVVGELECQFAATLVIEVSPCGVACDRSEVCACAEAVEVHYSTASCED